MVEEEETEAEEEEGEKKEEGEEEVEVYECLGWRRTRQTLRPSIPSFTVKA